MKKILVLNGSTRRGGRTDAMSSSFIAGAKEAGNEVREIFTAELSFNNVLYSVDQGHVRPIELDEVLSREGAEGDYYRAFYEADVIVFATPIYWWDIAGNLKVALDNIQDLLQSIGWDRMNKETVFLATAGGSTYDNPVHWYGYFKQHMNWNNLGMVLGIDNIDKARELGLSIK